MLFLLYEGEVGSRAGKRQYEEEEYGRAERHVKPFSKEESKREQYFLIS